MQDVTLLYALVLQALPVVQSESMRESTLIGHLKVPFFSGVTAIQQLRLRVECPCSILKHQKATYVFLPLVQIMKTIGTEDKGFLGIWKYQPIQLAAQLLMRVTSHSLEKIRGVSSHFTLHDCRALISTKRLVKAVENKYFALVNHRLKHTWDQAALDIGKEVQCIGLRTLDPNWWDTAIWYLEKNSNFHTLMRELTPKEGVGTENGPEMTERQITRFQREFQHSLLAAYTTYPRDFTLSDAFAEKAKLVLGTDLQVPTPAIVAVAQSVKLYADVLRSMPVVVEHSKEPDGPRKQEKIKENEPNELPGDDVAFCRKKRERPIASCCIIEKDERL